MNYSMLQVLAEKQQVAIHPYKFDGDLQALYMDNHIFLSDDLSDSEKTCILAEELGHHFTADRNCLDQNEAENLFCEWKGRIWSYEVLLPVGQLKAVMQAGLEKVSEIAAFFKLTKEFVKDALQYYFYSGQLKENALTEAATSDKGKNDKNLAQPNYK